MPALYILLALVACNGCSDKSQTDMPAETTKTKAETKPKARTGSGGSMTRIESDDKVGVETPAPSRAIWGLEIGGSSTEQIEAWLKEKGLDCPAEEQSGKKEVVYTCRSGVKPEVLAGRTIDGKVQQLLLVRAADGSLKQVTASRGYEDVAPLIADYNASRAAIESTLGKPSAAKDISGPSDFSDSMARKTTSWGFGDLTVTVTASKSINGSMAVSERWQTP